MRHVNFIVMSLGTGTMGLLIAGIAVWIADIFKLPEGRDEILLILALGVLSFLSICLITAALKFEEAGIVRLYKGT